MDYLLKSVKETQTFIANFKAELMLDLPGVNAHLRLAPEIRINDLKTGQTPEHAMESAVLIILYPFNERLYTVVILRNEYDGAHSGQISLPGGKAEDSDIDFEYTALREAREEIGIIPAEMEIIGQLSRFYVRPSNFIIYPFIAFCAQRPEFHPDPFEVQKIIEVDIFKDISYEKIVNQTLTFKNNMQVNAPGFPVGGEFMWGATSMIFSELLQVLDSVVKKLKKSNPT
jgi:8-oxo-dGTP pyrophosphatase MutT (NUDIX family)